MELVNIIMLKVTKPNIRSMEPEFNHSKMVLFDDFKINYNFHNFINFSLFLYIVVIFYQNFIKQVSLKYRTLIQYFKKLTKEENVVVFHLLYL